MDNLHINRHLAAVVGNDQDANGPTAALEALLQTAPQAALVNDRQVLLDVAGLGHGDDAALLHVQDTVLLEDRAEHGLHNHRRGGVADERRLLMQLLGEEVDAEVAVLAGSRRGADADDLARAALQDEDVAQADVVARDGHRVGGGGAALGRAGARAADLADLAELDTLGVVAFGVDDPVSKLVQAVAERVVVACLRGGEA